VTTFPHKNIGRHGFNGKADTLPQKRRKGGKTQKEFPGHGKRDRLSGGRIEKDAVEAKDVLVSFEEKGKKERESLSRERRGLRRQPAAVPRF